MMEQVTEISIKGMVCNRCILSLRSALEAKGAVVQDISPGKVRLLTGSISLTEISCRTNYSSVHYLSRQFKAVVGMNPSEYKVQDKQ